MASESPRVLILTQYYPPETGAPQGRLSSLAKHLKNFEYTVTVLTGMPNYPQGQIYEGYQFRMLMEENLEGIRVIRTWLYTSKRKTFVRRLANYFSFVFSSLFLGSWKLGPQDIVIVESPPLFLGLSAVLLSWTKGAKLIFNVSDLWPASAIEMGLLRNRLLIRLSEGLEDFLYRRSDMVTGQTQGIVDSIQKRFPEKDMALLRNGVDMESFPAQSVNNRKGQTKREFDLEGKFVVGYAGLHGMVHGLETVLLAARALLSEPSIHFSFLGDGPEKEQLIRTAKGWGLENVHFYPPEPIFRMPDIVSMFDIAVIPVRKLPFFRGTIPAKMPEAMAAEVPLVAAVEGEARDMVRESGAGIWVEPENSQAMADAILELYKDEKRRHRMGQRGRAYVMEHCNRKQIAIDFSHRLERLL